MLGQRCVDAMLAHRIEGAAQRERDGAEPQLKQTVAAPDWAFDRHQYDRCAATRAFDTPSRTDGTIATLKCDGGDRYAETIYSEAWLHVQGLDLTPRRDLERKVAAFALPTSGARDF